MAAPDQVTGLLVAAGDTEVALTWDVPADGGSPITDYVVEWQQVSAPGWTVFTDGTSTVAAATVTGLTNAEAYDFRVSAVNLDGTGLASVTATATPEEPGDNWAAALTLTGSGTAGFDLIGTTREVGEPVDAVGDGTAGTVWFAYTATGPGVLDVSVDLTDGVIEIFDDDPFTDIDLIASGQDALVDIPVAAVTYMIRVHAVNDAGSADGLTLTYDFVERVSTMTVTVAADLPSAPGVILASVTQGTPDAAVTFNLVGYGSNPVLEEILDPTGQLLLASIPIPAAAAGTHTLEAVTDDGTATDDFEVLADAPTEPSTPPTVPPAAPPTVPVQRWVLQDPKPGGTASYTFPNNPKAMSSPHPSRSITPVGTVAQGGQDLLWEGSARPHTWTFEGYAGSQEFIEALLSYVELNRRFYLVDHRRRAWEVSFENLDIDQRNDINNFWAVNYTVTAFVYSGPVNV